MIYNKKNNYKNNNHKKSNNYKINNYKNNNHKNQNDKNNDYKNNNCKFYKKSLLKIRQKLSYIEFRRLKNREFIKL